MNKKTFLICPVRDADPNKSWEIVFILEEEGWDVHWPHRDTDQNDETGLRICEDNLMAIKECDVIHFMWDGKSQGCLFDLGMAFALGKKVISMSLPRATPHKSFQNMVREYENRYL